MIEKLDRFDANAEEAVDRLIRRLERRRDEIIAVARARHITGHYVHGDGELFEHNAGRLEKEILEELADAVVYDCRQQDVE